jgi:hypothetical protein
MLCYQGTTLVGPHRPNKDLGFNPALFFYAGFHRDERYIGTYQNRLLTSDFVQDKP